MRNNSSRFASRSRSFATRASDSKSNSDAVQPVVNEKRKNREKIVFKDHFPPNTSVHSSEGTASLVKNKSIQRVKSLAVLVAISIAVALFSILYGLWATTTAQASIEHTSSNSAKTLVSTVDIAAGDILSLDYFEVKEIPEAFRSTELVDVEALEGSLLNSRALVDMPAGTQLSSSFITGNEGGNKLAAQLPRGMEAVTINVDAESGLAGRIGVYDYVRIVTVEGTSEGGSFLNTLCSRVRVLAVGENISSSEGTYSSLTVEVTPDEANAIRKAQQMGTVSLTLLSSLDTLVEGESHG